MKKVATRLIAFACVLAVCFTAIGYTSVKPAKAVETEEGWYEGHFDDDILGVKITGRIVSIWVKDSDYTITGYSYYNDQEDFIEYTDLEEEAIMVLWLERDLKVTIKDKAGKTTEKVLYEGDVPFNYTEFYNRDQPEEGDENARPIIKLYKEDGTQIDPYDYLDYVVSEDIDPNDPEFDKTVYHTLSLIVPFPVHAVIEGNPEIFEAEFQSKSVALNSDVLEFDLTEDGTDYMLNAWNTWFNYNLLFVRLDFNATPGGTQKPPVTPSTPSSPSTSTPATTPQNVVDTNNNTAAGNSIGVTDGVYKEDKTITIPSGTAGLSYKSSKSGKATTTTISGTYKASKSGIYTVDYNGQKVTFTIDKKKPTLNVKNGKKYKKGFKVNAKDDLSGVKQVTLNGKKVKASFKLSKRGKNKIVVTDKAGNKTSVSVKVK